MTIRSGSSWANGSGYVDPTYASAMHDKKTKNKVMYVNSESIERFRSDVNLTTSIKELYDIAHKINKQLEGDISRRDTIDTLKIKQKILYGRIYKLKNEGGKNEG